MSDVLTKSVVQLSSILLTARKAASVDSTAVVEGQQILASITGATHDVSIHYNSRFQTAECAPLTQPSTFSSPDEPNYGRQPKTVADVLGLDHKG